MLASLQTRLIGKGFGGFQPEVLLMILILGELWTVSFLSEFSCGFCGITYHMLAEIDGLNDSSQDLFIIGASNRPDLIDASLLSPGRFDKLLYVGVATDPPYRERVLKALTRKFRVKDVSLYSIAKKCPPKFTGADIYAFCVDVWFHAAKRKVLATDADPTNLKDDVDSVVVEYEDFVTTSL
ncbi:putative ATPase, AAA-type, core, P-loop containing nucleoside triphosphate hydrolase [Helianthus annuus]|uniref:ATPase, AAA-type, core, P-loop containing nucleoside triphosphate hydrolase n=1 Tax=Helianthus annuus TaxID=4232 RepID=A0A9K3HP27_HELAN|nr:peroxisome biogenesis protein 6 isoform X2 [Helianthus annuus]XP_035835207.1 peroxisome biogenesis protein 6 isoform X2 [Helianthus annuus]XP_035835208.1 peroxisome biogenesis protein 6 isoform X2 [Helianthus annuus]KAF5781772.1 putative ATPase, AAA-type, core, P-loop containing nucleoside triphosphate hydrolase [Helianthus annuus]KAJ0874908.1 putative ATPase, AAA-type, core, P-loop containing nucleoside triphosphate hydrolase [Helianthus annuus]